VSPSDALTDVLGRLVAAERVVLSTHVRPDGDALGSQIALALFLGKLGKRVWIINADPPPRNVEWMMDLHKLTTFTGALKQLKAIAEADALVMVDTNTLARIGDVGQPFKNASGQKLLLDHHPEPETWFDAAYVETTAAAAGEMVYELIAAHDPGLIDADIATALYTAIMTDTGSFRFGATTARTHRIVAELLERGDIRPEPIHVATYDSRQASSLRLLARVLDTITPVYDGQVAYAVISQQALEATGARSDEAEGFTSYPLSLEGVQAMVMFLETSGGVKCSFRSKGDVAINGWARRFGGGGHRNAAGAFLPGRPLRQAIDEVIAAAPKYLDLGQEYDHDNELSSDDLALLASFQGKL
jgi:bifunctional oligoribonuclease and PAP phosphatase NrnA